MTDHIFLNTSLAHKSNSFYGFLTERILILYVIIFHCLSVLCCSVAQLCLTSCDLTDRSAPGLPVLHQLPELAQTHVHRVSDATQPSHPLSSPSPPAPNLSQHQGLFQWVSSSHQVAKGLELQLQHRSFQWIFRMDFLLPSYGYLNFQRLVPWDPVCKGTADLVCTPREFCILYLSLYPCFLVQLTLESCEG